MYNGSVAFGPSGRRLFAHIGFFGRRLRFHVYRGEWMRRRRRRRTDDGMPTGHRKRTTRVANGFTVRCLRFLGFVTPAPCKYDGRGEETVVFETYVTGKCTRGGARARALHLELPSVRARTGWRERRVYAAVDGRYDNVRFIRAMTTMRRARNGYTLVYVGRRERRVKKLSTKHRLITRIRAHLFK